MILVNIDHIPGKDFDVIGIAEGNMIQTKHIGKDIMAGLKTLVGGELKGYTQMMNEARQMATKRMVESAQNMGADAIVNIRYATSTITQGAAEVIAYGTAVKLK